VYTSPDEIDTFDDIGDRRDVTSNSVSAPDGDTCDDDRLAVDEYDDTDFDCDCDLSATLMRRDCGCVGYNINGDDDKEGDALKHARESVDIALAVTTNPGAACKPDPAAPTFTLYTAPDEIDTVGDIGDRRDVTSNSVSAPDGDTCDDDRLSDDEYDDTDFDCDLNATSMRRDCGCVGYNINGDDDVEEADILKHARESVDMVSVDNDDDDEKEGDILERRRESADSNGEATKADGDCLDATSKQD
jgi:hypothetical protein